MRRVMMEEQALNQKKKTEEQISYALLNQVNEWVNRWHAWVCEEK